MIKFTKLKRMKEFYKLVIEPVYNNVEYYKQISKNLNNISPKKSFFESIEDLSELIDKMVGDVLDENYNISYPQNSPYWWRLNGK